MENKIFSCCVRGGHGGEISRDKTINTINYFPGKFVTIIDKILTKSKVAQNDLKQGSAILSESVRNRDTKVPGIGIGIEFCTSLGLSIGLGIEFFYFWVPHSINWDISSYFTL